LNTIQKVCDLFALQDTDSDTGEQSEPQHEEQRLLAISCDALGILKELNHCSLMV